MNRFNSTLRPPTKGMKRSQLRRKSKLRAVRKVEPSTEAWMKNKLTVLFSKFILQRDPYCYCGETATENGHFYTRAIPSTEYDPDNCLGSCHACNQLHEYNKTPMRTALTARIGDERMTELERRAWEHTKLTFGELEDLLEQYTERAA